MIELRNALKSSDDPISNATINTLFASLSSAYSYFVEQGWCSENPLPLDQPVAEASPEGSVRRRFDLACTPSRVLALRLEFDAARVPGWNEINAIGVAPCEPEPATAREQPALGRGVRVIGCSLRCPSPPLSPQATTSRPPTRGSYSSRCAGTPRAADVVIEVIWSRSTIDKLEIYRRLKIPEVWFWKDGALSIHVLASGLYHTADRSALLPELDLVLLCSFLYRPRATQAMRDFRDALRTAP